MSLSTLHSCFDGYSDRILDQQILTVHTGYWAGYYAMSKHPKDTSYVIKKMIEGQSKKTQKHAPDIDVEAFLDMEARFAEKLTDQRGDSIE